MPRQRSARIGAHQPSVKLSKRQFAVQEDAVETVEIGAADNAETSGQDVLESLNASPPIVSKKGKKRLKHEALIDRIKESSATPYSKAQKRRFNRRQREQLGGGLGSIKAAISVLEEKETPSPRLDTSSEVQRPQAKARTGLIGEGKGVPLTKSQRKRVLETEQLRHPLILTNPQFSVNPFQTIRTHAQNTLEKHTETG